MVIESQVNQPSFLTRISTEFFPVRKTPGGISNVPVAGKAKWAGSEF